MAVNQLEEFFFMGPASLLALVWNSSLFHAALSLLWASKKKSKLAANGGENDAA